RLYFQAEDGIRDGRVTGVQTCALPISLSAARRASFISDRCKRSAKLLVLMTTSPQSAQNLYRRFDPDSKSLCRLHEMLRIERDDRPRAAIYSGFENHIVFRILDSGSPPVFQANLSRYRDEVAQENVDVFGGSSHHFQLIPPLQYALILEKERNGDHYFKSTV